ncbi:MAG: hypothetical protein PHC70_04385 [Patescibacteria group bacterium]|jgi:hypothetical protein|nr:hypothetical protein [Patescibacteria group bacterium]
MNPEAMPLEAAPETLKEPERKPDPNAPTLESAALEPETLEEPERTLEDIPTVRDPETTTPSGTLRSPESK